MSVEHLIIAVVGQGRRKIQDMILELTGAECSKGGVIQKIISGRELRVMYPLLEIRFKAISLNDGYNQIYGMRYDAVLYETNNVYALNFAVDTLERCVIKSKVLEAYQLMEFERYLKTKHLYKCVRED